MDYIDSGDQPNSSVLVASLYMVGREHARRWMNSHPDASEKDLIEHLGQFSTSWPMSPTLFDEIVRGITCRVFFMRRLNNLPMP